MNKKVEGIIATTTWYKNYPQDPVDQVRGSLAVDLVNAAIGKRAQVVVVDGGSSQEFQMAIKKPHVHLHQQTERGMSASRQQAFKIASDVMKDGWICWTEPEKVSFVKDCLDLATKDLTTNQADLVVPARDNKAFETYPPYQADYERESNRQWNQLLREEGVLKNGQPDLDAFFGPKVWRWEIFSLFLRRYKAINPDSSEASDIKPGEYCNAILFPVVAALLEGKRVRTVPVPYRHPVEQTAIEKDSPQFRDKRIHQQTTILATTREYLRLVRHEQSLLIEDDHR
jgi:glycosyltransferase involved in cell wall biosynthesis